MTTLVLTIFLAIFMAVLALCFGIQAARQSPGAELKRRIERMAASEKIEPTETITREIYRQTTPFEKFIRLLPLMGRITSLVEHAGLRIGPLRFVLLSGLVTLACTAIVYLLRGSLLAALLTLVVVGCLPVAYLVYRKQQRQTLFNEQLPDALTMVARSLRAGHSLAGAIELISNEMPEPTSGLFRTVYEQQQLGMRITDALRLLLNKIESIDLHFFVTIIRINSETGGNLAEILDKLADTIRSRLQIRRQVRVYSAQGRMSGYILTILPLVVFIAFSFLNPDYMKVFYTEKVCQFSLLAALLAQGIGFVMIRKIVDIRI